MADSRPQPDAPTFPGIPAGISPEAFFAQMAMMAASQNNYFAQMQQKPPAQHSPDGSVNTPPPFQPPPFNFMVPPHIWNANPMQTADVIAPNEEEHIVRTLSAYIRQGRNHNEALNSLNGVSGKTPLSFENLTHNGV